MKFKPLAAALAGAIVLSSAPLLASATLAQPGPIHIDNADVRAPENTSSAGEALVYPGSVKIGFTNNNTLPANDVVFALISNGHVAARINDAGSFAPGVTISHAFPEQAHNVQNVAVAKATFADGTVWSNPDVPTVPAVSMNPGVPVTAVDY